MRIFLLQNVNKLGNSGELVSVRDGYARNFLIPRSLAIPVTKGTQNQVDEQRKHLTLAIQRDEKRAQELKDKIEQLVLEIKVQAGKDEKIFGAVTNRMIQQGLKDQGVLLDKKKIIIEKPIHKLGSHAVPVKLSTKIEASIKIKVVKS